MREQVTTGFALLLGIGVWFTLAVLVALNASAAEDAFSAPKAAFCTHYLSDEFRYAMDNGAVMVPMYDGLALDAYRAGHIDLQQRAILLSLAAEKGADSISTFPGLNALVSICLSSEEVQ